MRYLFFVDSILLTLSDNTVDPPLVYGMPMWLAWVVIGILLILSSMIALCENAYSTCNKYHFRVEAEKGKKYAKIITKLVDKFDNTLVTILVTFNTISTITSFISAIIWLNIATANHWADGVEAIVSTVVMGLLVYIVTDTVPKVISRQIPDQIAIMMAYPLYILQFILWPIIFCFRKLLGLIHKMLHLEEESLLSKEDIIFEAKEAINEDNAIIEKEDEEVEEQEKLFEKDEAKILDNIFTFDERKVSQIYVPLDKVYSLDINGLTAEKVNQTIVDIDYSRIPIYDEKKDNIIGVLVFRLYFEEYTKDKHLSIPSILEDVVEIPLDMTLNDAFNELNSQKVHLGIVKQDDKVLGIVTMEDILEELVDDISEDPTREKEVELEHE